MRTHEDFWNVVFCEKTQEELWYFLCKDTQISCINRFYSYSDLSVFCENTWEMYVLWKNTCRIFGIFLCKDTQISCINRFYSYSDLSVWYKMRCFVRTQEGFFLCKDTQISCINRFYSYSDLSVLIWNVVFLWKNTGGSLVFFV